MPSSKDNAHVFIYTKSKKIAKRFYIQKARHFSKSQTISVTFLYTKSNTLYVTGSFMKFLKLAFIYKKHDALRYVTFLFTKIQTVRKKQDNLRYVFIYKNPELCVTWFFIEFLKCSEGGGGIYLFKKGTLRDIFILKKMHFVLSCYIQRA